MKSETTFMPRWIFAALALVLMSVLVCGAWFYRHQSQMIRRQAEADLEAIARLKVNQIAGWRNERLGDGAVLMARPFMIERIAQWMAHPTENIYRTLLTEFGAIRRFYTCADILLADPDGNMRLSLSGRGEMHSGYKAAFLEAVRERKPVFVDLHRETQNSKPHISVIAPLFSSGEPASKPVGAIILVTNAEQFLYPLIQSWPLPNQTAETLLVRRDGDDVLFLNELRHRKNTALKLRIPLQQTDLPAALAVRGGRGIVQGKDYRGVEVAAVILPVPDSPWFMVSKIDAEEIYAGWRVRAWLILALMTGQVGLVMLLGVFFWQREKKRRYLALYQSESALRVSIERHSITLKAIGDAVIATDAQGRVELLNPVAEALTGWCQAEALGKPIAEVFHIVNEETRKVVESPVTRVLREGLVVGLANHTLLVAKDGVARPIADSGAPIRNEQGEITGVVLVFRDQSEERRAQRLTEIRLALIDYAAVHSLDELLTKALDEIGALVKSPIGFYHFVADDQKALTLQQWSTKTLETFCKAEGKGLHYDIDQAGVWVACVHAKKPVIHNDYAGPPHKKGMPEGHAEVVRELVAPVMRDGKVVAILGVGNKPADYTEKDAETVAFLADVTWEIVHRQRADMAEREKEKRFREIFENISAGIAIYEAIENGEDFVFKDINPAGAEGGKKAREAHFGKSVLEVYPGVREMGLFDVFQEVWRTGISRRHPVCQYRDDRIAIWVENYVCRLPSGEVMAVYEDLTERMRAEAERSRLLAAIEQAGEVVVITDVEGIIQYVNPMFERVTGYSSREAIGQNPRMLKSGKQDAAFYRQLWQTIGSGQTWKGRLVNKRKDGTLLTEAATISPVLGAQGQIVNYVAVKRDITEFLRLEAQYQQAQKMESVGRLAGGVAHDFNNMLSVILGFTELALEKVAPADALHADLKEVFTAAQRSAEITRQLLAFARKQTVSPRVLDLNATVEGMLKMLRRLIGEDIDLAWLPEQGVWPVKIDPSQIEQILANLCVNARDAIGGLGKVTIETHKAAFDQAYCAEHAGFVPGEFVLLAASDDGCGMDKETLDNIFEPFFTTKDVNEGTGLGLATVYGIVKQNNGFINVYSEPEKGTTFKIYLPRHVGEAEKKGPEIVPQIPSGCGEWVLLVEDEPGIRKMGEMMLERLGYKVLAAGAPEQALALAAEHKDQIRLLITDVVMPGMNGRDLADRVHALCPHINIIFMSGYTANVIAHRGVLDEGIRFIQKPFSLQELAVKARTALDQK